VERLTAGSGYQATAERVGLEDLGLEHPDRVGYTASFGCGKGRIVLEAAQRYRFQRVVGVELAPELSRVAREIVAREQARLRCSDVRIETADATEYPVPDDMSHAYLYNPFTGTTFERVRENILDSLDRAPRPLRIIYLNPVEHEALTAGGRFRLVRRVRLPRVGSAAAIYDAA
jgi:tRNA1(Val) A37 N6-methylase TrmN6